jgi:hypothetical protein
VCTKNLPHTLAAVAADKVAATILLDGLKTFGAALGVSEDPLDVLSLRTLGIPFLPYGARARRMCMCHAVKAEA